MDAFPDAFAADVMVLTDCENPAVDVPGLTVSLRGLLEVEVTCESAECDVHSGLWGNIAPDPAIALTQLVARLVDQDGRMALGRRPVDPKWMEESRAVPLDRDTIKKGAHLMSGIEPLPERGLSPAAWAWRQPAVTVLSTTLPAPGREKNAIRRAASAKLSCRVAPGQTADELYAEIERAVCKEPPGGVRVTMKRLGGGASSWDYAPKGPAFEAADRAYQKAWGRPLVRIGVGGSIPFVALFGRRFGNLPLILNGVIDPETTAHGPNESMHVGVFEKAMLANVYLLDELSRLPSR
jgi:acetylornithine deacetylase/succinyl-diaminopimelate desuccinylase-like protein